MPGPIVSCSLWLFFLGAMNRLPCFRSSDDSAEGTPKLTCAYVQTISRLLRATEGAAVTIQRLARARMARARLTAFLQLLAVLRVQRVARGHLARVALRHSHPHALVSSAPASRNCAEDDGGVVGKAQAAPSVLPSITYAVGSGRGRVYWESGGRGGGALVGSWANALWTPPQTSLLP